MTLAPIRRLGLLAAFITLGSSAHAAGYVQQIKIDRALNSPTLTVKYNGVHAALVELRLNGESFGSRTMDEGLLNGETTFSLEILALKDGDNEVEIRLYDKAGHVVGSQKTTISAESDKKGPVFLSTPKVGENVIGPVEINVGFGKTFKDSYVSFFIDNQFKAMMNIPPFTYTWDTSRETNGWHEVEAWVVDDTSSTYKTRKVRVYVNNPGGHTYRPVTTPAKPIVKPAVTASAPLPKATPSKPIVTPAQPAKTVVATKVAPAPIDLIAFATANSVIAHLARQSSDSKPAPIQPSVAVGPRLMTPTGKRVVVAQTVATPVTQGPEAPKTVAAATKIVPVAQTIAAPTKPTVAAQTIPAPKPTTVVKPSTIAAPQTAPAKVVAAPVTAPAKVVPAPVPGEGQELALAPTAQPQPAVAIPHRVSPDPTSEVVERPTTVGSEPARPIVPAMAVIKPVPTPTVVATAVKITKPVAVAPKPVSHVIPVNYGTRLGITSSYTVVLNGEALNFDVQPSVLDGVPMTPFRHLIEKSGGEVKWMGADHEVTANADGRDIWLKIGEKYAKVDSLAVQLELAPFLQGGRTIVPLSFLRSALNVNIDYDKATNHVLITAKK